MKHRLKILALVTAAEAVAAVAVWFYVEKHAIPTAARFGETKP